MAVLQTPSSQLQHSLKWNSKIALHLRYCKTLPNLSTRCYGYEATFSTNHGLEEGKKGGFVKSSNAATKSSLSFKTLPPELSVIPSVVRVEPKIYPGRCVDAEDTEGMSTPTEERGDLLTKNISNSKLIALWTSVTRILMHHPTFIGKRSETGSSPFFP